MKMNSKQKVIPSVVVTHLILRFHRATVKQRTRLVILKFYFGITVKDLQLVLCWSAVHLFSEWNADDY